MGFFILKRRCAFLFFLHSRGAHPIVAMGAASRDNE